MLRPSSLPCVPGCGRGGPAMKVQLDDRANVGKRVANERLTLSIKALASQRRSAQ